MKSSAIADTLHRGKDPKAGEAGRQARRCEGSRLEACSAAQACAGREAPVSKPTATPVEIAPADELVSASGGVRRHRLAFASVVLVVLVAASAAGFLLLRGDDRSPQSVAGAPAGVSAERLASLVSSHNGPVYWAGSHPRTQARAHDHGRGTFVRYLPLSVSVGDSDRAITVATYPLRNAYATAVSRSKSARDVQERDSRRRSRRVEPDSARPASTWRSRVSRTSSRSTRRTRSRPARWLSPGASAQFASRLYGFR